MKFSKIIAGALALIISGVSAIYAQQQITQTVTAQNKNCNATCSVIDLPELNGNPGAVVFVTQNGGNPNPHPVGAYYMYLNKWSVFNMDSAAMTDGAKFTVEYYPNSDSNHFVYIVSNRGSACVDHAGLNDNPGAQVRATAHVSSTIGNIWNQYPTKVDFDSSTRKWCITNINNNPISANTAYNIAFSAGTGVITSHPGQGINPNSPVLQTTNTSASSNCIIPTSLPPTGNAGGDLTGTYPDPVVKGLRGMPISIKPPAIGQVLKWNGSAWESGDDNVSLPPQNVPTPKPSVLSFNQSNPPSLMLQMLTPNVNSAPIGGLNNQFFTLPQSGRVVFYTTIAVQNGNGNLFPGPVSVWLTAEIQNPSGVTVARSVAEAVLGAGSEVYTIVAVGIGSLPAGTYHTSVTMSRGSNGSALRVYDVGYAAHPTQGGQLIIEIFPD